MAWGFPASVSRGCLSAFFYFAEFPRLHIVDKSTHGNMLRNPGMRFYALHLLADVRLKVVESIEMSGFTGHNTHLFGQLRAQFVFLNLEQAAVGMVDDDELLRVEQVMRDDQRAQRVFGGDAAGVTDHVS